LFISCAGITIFVKLAAWFSHSQATISLTQMQFLCTVTPLAEGFTGIGLALGSTTKLLFW